MKQRGKEVTKEGQSDGGREEGMNERCIRRSV